MQYQHPNSLSADERRWREYLIGRLNKLEALHMTTQATLTDLDKSLDSIETAVAALPGLITTQSDDLTTLFKDLAAKFASYGITPNFITEVNRANAIAANLKTIASTISANTAEVTNEDATVVDPPKPVPAVTATVLTSSNAPSVTLGDTLVFDAVVEESPVGKVPTGIVNIGDVNGNVLASITLDATGAGRASIVPTKPGTYSYVAVYEGDDANSGSASTPLSFTVAEAPTPVVPVTPAPPAFQAPGAPTDATTTTAPADTTKQS
jgi:hypothetical protein